MPVSMLMRLWIASAKVLGLREIPVCTGVGKVGDGSRLVGGSFGDFGLIAGDLCYGFGLVRNINLRVVDYRITEHGYLYFSTFEPPQLPAVTETAYELAVWRFSLCSYDSSEL